MLEGQLIKTITDDRLELQGFWIDNKSDIAIFHSHGTSGDFYTHKFIDVLGETYSSKNISFLTANNRGHDVYAYLRKNTGGKIKWTTIGGAFERFEDCIFDIKAWLDFLEEKRVKKVILQGHSLTQKLVYYQSMKNDPRVIGQIHLSPGNDAGFMRFRLGEEKYFETNKLIKEMVEQGRERELLQEELAIVCPMAALAYYGYLTEDGVGNVFPYHNPGSTKWEALSKIKDPLLVIFGERDIFIKPSVDEAARLFKEKMNSPELITVEKITGANHSFIGYEKEVADIIHEWLKINYSHHMST